MTSLKTNMNLNIKSEREIQDNIAKELELKGEKYFRCPTCGYVYKDACGLIKCHSCGYTREDYTDKNGTILKIKKQK